MGRTSIIRWVSLCLSLIAVGACTAPPAGQPGQYPNQNWGPDPSQGGGEGGSACNPDDCDDFCWYANCLIEGDMTGDQCEAGCLANCGNGFFDDEDAAMIACMAATGPDLMCDNAQACCSNHFTSELCP